MKWDLYKIKPGKYWEIIIYPESMPANWESIIEKTRIPCALSPLHDIDGWWKINFFNADTKFQEKMEKESVFTDDNYCEINPLDIENGIYKDAKNNEYKIFVSPSGEKIQKKPHYHLLLKFDQSGEGDEARKLSKKLGSYGAVKYIRQPYYAYLNFTHKDDPVKKALYREEDIRFFNGFVWYKDIKILDNEIIREWREAIKSFVNEESICSFVDLEKRLKRLADDNVRPELYYYVDTHQAEWDRYCRANQTYLEYENRFKIKIRELEKDNERLRTELADERKNKK